MQRMHAAAYAACIRYNMAGRCLQHATSLHAAMHHHLCVQGHARAGPQQGPHLRRSKFLFMMLNSCW
jgi:hypothetical protein